VLSQPTLPPPPPVQPPAATVIDAGPVAPAPPAPPAPAPLPPAPYVFGNPVAYAARRFLAFALDLVLVTAVATMLLYGLIAINPFTGLPNNSEGGFDATFGAGAGIALVVLAFAAGTRVADTREGLIAEVVTLLGGLAGISLLLYGLFAGAGRATAPRPRATLEPSARARVRPLRELLTGAGGIVLAILLVFGLAISGGLQWAALGSALLLPMVAGSVYLCIRFLRAPERDWRLDLRKTGRS